MIIQAPTRKGSFSVTGSIFCRSRFCTFKFNMPPYYSRYAASAKRQTSSWSGRTDALVQFDFLHFDFIPLTAARYIVHGISPQNVKRIHNIYIHIIQPTCTAVVPKCAVVSLEIIVRRRRRRTALIIISDDIYIYILLFYFLLHSFRYLLQIILLDVRDGTTVIEKVIVRHRQRAALVGKPQLRLFFAVETTPVIHFQFPRTYIYIYINCGLVKVSYCCRGTNKCISYGIPENTNCAYTLYFILYISTWVVPIVTRTTYGNC